MRINMKVLIVLVVLLACVTVASFYHSFGVQRWDRGPGRLQLLTVQVREGIVGIVWDECDNAIRVPPTPVRYTLMIAAGYNMPTTWGFGRERWRYPFTMMFYPFGVSFPIFLTLLF